MHKILMNSKKNIKSLFSKKQIKKKYLYFIDFFYIFLREKSVKNIPIFSTILGGIKYGKQ